MLAVSVTPAVAALVPAVARRRSKRPAARSAGHTNNQADPALSANEDAACSRAPGRWGSRALNPSYGVDRQHKRLKCGHKGATLTLPSASPERGWYPFPKTVSE